MTYPSLDGRRFKAPAAVIGGEVGPSTVFEYRQDDGSIWATYAGGAVVRGFLVGTRTEDSLSFRYCQLNVDGETSTGQCSSVISVADGRVRLEETWAWESREGSGTSALEEVIE